MLDDDPSEVCLAAAREFGFMPNDRECLEAALAKVESVAPRRIAPMHCPVLTSHISSLVQAFRDDAFARQ